MVTKLYRGKVYNLKIYLKPNKTTGSEKSNGLVGWLFGHCVKISYIGILSKISKSSKRHVNTYNMYRVRVLVK